MKVLVTGGAGFIGNRVVRLLAARGDDVVVIDNLRVGMPMPTQAQGFVGDIRDVAAMQRVLTQTRPEMIVHLAALHHIPTCEKNPSEAFDINVLGTQVLLDAAEKAAIKKLVLASSAAVYEWAESALCEDETPLHATDVYSVCKRANEDQCRLWASRVAGRVGMARIFNVIGHDDPNGHIIPDILKQITSAKNTVALGNTTPKRDYTHADDTAQGIVAIMDHLEKGEAVEAYNLSRGEEFSVEDIVQAVAKILHVEITITHDASRARKIDRLHLLGDIRKAKEKLGWQAMIGFEEALKRILQELRPHQVAA